MRNEIDLVNEEDCKKYTGFDLQHWIDFTGVKIAQPDFNRSEGFFIATFIVDEDKITIEIINDYFELLRADIYRSGKYVYFDYLITHEDKINGALLNIVKGMTKHCYENGYLRISAIAAGNDRYVDKKYAGIKYVGVKILGRYGFLPADQDVKDILAKTILEFTEQHKDIVQGKTIRDLYDLHQYKGGIEAFITNLNAANYTGWHGYFDLKLGSRSFQILEAEDEKKKKNK